MLKTSVNLPFLGSIISVYEEDSKQSGLEISNGIVEMDACNHLTLEYCFYLPYHVVTVPKY